MIANPEIPAYRYPQAKWQFVSNNGLPFRAFHIKNSPAVTISYLVGSARIRSREDQVPLWWGGVCIQSDAVLLIPIRGTEQITGFSHKQDSNLT